MNKTVEVVQVETTKDLALKYFENPAQNFMVGFAKDIQKHLLCVRYLDDHRGFAGYTIVEKGHFSIEHFQHFCPTAINNCVDEDLYVMYVLEEPEIQFLTLGDIFGFEEHTEFGERFLLNCKDQTVSSTILKIDEVKENLKQYLSPRKAVGTVALI